MNSLQEGGDYVNKDGKHLEKKEERSLKEYKQETCLRKLRK